MKRISTIDEIQDAVKYIRDFKKDYCTNLFYDGEKFNLWIRKGLFYIVPGNEIVLFLKQNNSFYNVYYCATSLSKIASGLKTLKENYSGKEFVFDIIGKESGLTDIITVFHSNGYFLYTKLIRMSRLISETEYLPENTSIRFADIVDAGEINLLLNRYFDIYAEQLPLDDEIKNWIIKNHILLFIYEKLIIGFVIFDIIGFTSYLRYWFVHPEHRNKKVGSLLLRKFFLESRATKRQLFWVIQSNENAITRYKHYGFLNEDLVDLVFINANKKYEERNT